MTQKQYIRHSEQLISLIFFVKNYHKKSRACFDTYAAIARYWNPQGNIFPNQETLAALVGVAPRTIRTHISQLKKMGLLDFHQPTEKGKPPKSNHYTFIVETLKLWVEDAKKAKRELDKKLRAEREVGEKQDDPTPPQKYDPPITSSLHSEDKVNNITGTTKTFVPTALDWIFRNASVSESEHRDRLVIKSAKRRKKKWIKQFLETKRNAQENIRQDEKTRKQNECVASKQSKLDGLESALSAWITTGKDFTNLMLNELYQLRGGRLSPIMEHFANRFKEAQTSG